MIKEKINFMNKKEAEELFMKTLNTFNTQVYQFLVDYKPVFVSTRTSISTQISGPNDVINTNTTHNSFISFTKVNQKKRLVVEHHNHKLALSFVREATSNGGPLSKELTEQKWKATTAFDAKMRNIFMKVNRNFDDHHEASMLRDSIKFDKSEQPIVVPFKRILDQNLSFAIQQKQHDVSQAKLSFSSCLLTIGV